MDPHVTTSRDPGNCGGSASAAVSSSLSRLAHEWRDERTSDGRHPTYDRSDCRSSKAAVEISPSDAVVRRALTWRGMAAETVKAREASRIEVRFRAPVHLLILFEEGARRDGLTWVKDCRGRGSGTTRASSPSCLRVTNTMIGRNPPASPGWHISISIRRCCRSNARPGMPTCLWPPDCSSRMRGCGTSRSG
jgi:hypothetical protein